MQPDIWQGTFLQFPKYMYVALGTYPQLTLCWFLMFNFLIGSTTKAFSYQFNKFSVGPFSAGYLSNFLTHKQKTKKDASVTLCVCVLYCQWSTIYSPESHIQNNDHLEHLSLSFRLSNTSTELQAIKSTPYSTQQRPSTNRCKWRRSMYLQTPMRVSIAQPKVSSPLEMSLNSIQ